VEALIFKGFFSCAARTDAIEDVYPIFMTKLLSLFSVLYKRGSIIYSVGILVCWGQNVLCKIKSRIL
jgi:hypothetical protein